MGSGISEFLWFGAHTRPKREILEKRDSLYVALPNAANREALLQTIYILRTRVVRRQCQRGDD